MIIIVLVNKYEPSVVIYWPAPIQTSYFIGSYNLHHLMFSGIGALLCRHPYCFPSQSQTLFGIGTGRPFLIITF